MAIFCRIMISVRTFSANSLITFLLSLSVIQMGFVPSAVKILKRLQREQISEAQVINLKIIMKNIYAYSETVSKILSSAFDTVLQLLEGCKSSLCKEKFYNQLFSMTMKSKGQVDWFKPHDEGAAFMSST